LPAGRVAEKLRAYHQQGMALAAKQDRGTSGKSRTQADLSRTWIEGMLPGCSQQEGVIDHVRLQPPFCRIASSTRGRQASFYPISYFGNTWLCRDWPGRHGCLPAAWDRSCV